MPVKKEVSKISAPLVDEAGKVTGNFSLPEEVFAAKVNKSLLAQAIRVYQNNLKSHHSNTKTRSEVQGSTRKIYKQKGTGRARHGSIRAPIFIKGGIALGPKYRKTLLELPKKMKRAALLSALSLRQAAGFVLVASELKFNKTHEVKQFTGNLSKESLLVVTQKGDKNFKRGFKNLTKMAVLDTDNLNAFEVIKYQSLILTKKAVEELKNKNKEEKK